MKRGITRSGHAGNAAPSRSWAAGSEIGVEMEKQHEFQRGRLNTESFASCRLSRSAVRAIDHVAGVEAVSTVEEVGGDSSQWPAGLERLVGDVEVREKPLYYRFVKRAFDIAFSSCVIVVGFVPGLVLSAFIVADTKGSPIYHSTRIGRHGRYFKILKFRSMVADADNLEKYFTLEQLNQWHREHKVDGDPRITKLGAFLRSSSIDEIPQFVNVFLGQMSTVGSRAVSAEEVEYFGKGKDLLLSLRPGITGLWQTGPRNAATFETGLRQEFELMYAKNACLKLDAKLFFQTFKTMVERTGK